MLIILFIAFIVACLYQLGPSAERKLLRAEAFSVLHPQSETVPDTLVDLQ